MGYACPVCETPQADAGHLANHLAFTAMLGDDDHEGWLDEHAPDWEEDGERELADRVVEHAAEAEFSQVFEDTTGGDAHEHDADEPRPGALFEDDGNRNPRGYRGSGGASGTGGTGVSPDVDAAGDPEIQQAMAEAREMTRQRQGGEPAKGEEEDDGTGREDTTGDGGGESQ